MQHNINLFNNSTGDEVLQLVDETLQNERKCVEFDPSRKMYDDIHPGSQLVYCRKIGGPAGKKNYVPIVATRLIVRNKEKELPFYNLSYFNVVTIKFTLLNLTECKQYKAALAHSDEGYQADIHPFRDSEEFHNFLKISEVVEEVEEAKKETKNADNEVVLGKRKRSTVSSTVSIVEPADDEDIITKKIKKSSNEWIASKISESSKVSLVDDVGGKVKMESSVGSIVSMGSRVQKLVDLYEDYVDGQPDAELWSKTLALISSLAEIANGSMSFTSLENL